MNFPYRTNAAPAIAPIKVTRRIYPKHVAMIRNLAGAGVFTLFTIAAPATETGCNATTAQVQQSVLDGEALAACIIGSVLGGITDPLVLAQRCGGALPAVIADVIALFETKQVAAQLEVADAGGPPPDVDSGSATLMAAARRPISDREKLLLDTAKRNAALLVASSQKR